MAFHPAHWLVWLCLWPVLALQPTGEPVRYPPEESATDQRSRYPVQLLELALHKAGGQYVAVPASVPASQSRNLLLLAANQGIDVFWTVTSWQREQQLLAVPVPIDRGLFGWRLLLIREGEQPRYSAITELAALANWSGGQGHDWPDAQILRAAGLRIETSPSYDGLFGMLLRRHIDYFPRSVAELWQELDAQQDQPIALEQTLALHYPSAQYFFVHPDNQPLAAALELGLRRAIEDGSFLSLFEQHYGRLIAKAGLGRRRVLELSNPQLPSSAPLADRSLWFSPDTPSQGAD